MFILQNTEQVEVALFGADPDLPLGVALLLAAVLGALTGVGSSERRRDRGRTVAAATQRQLSGVQRTSVSVREVSSPGRFMAPKTSFLPPWAWSAGTCSVSTPTTTPSTVYVSLPGSQRTA